LIELRDITRRYGTVAALDGVSLTIAAGEFVAITGASGSGKSTLLNILGMLDRPTSGSYDLAGSATEGLPESRRTQWRARHIGFIFQAFHLVPHLTATENVTLGLSYAQVPRGQRDQVARSSLTAVGLAQRLDAFPATLSGGEQQRVAVARAIARQPAVLLCDEPTGNLDTETSAVVMRLLQRARGPETALVVVTHNPEISALADRTITISDGRVVGQGRSR
jgi:putative ABC transport system ATP-binding protein